MTNNPEVAIELLNTKRLEFDEKRINTTSLSLTNTINKKDFQLFIKVENEKQYNEVIKLHSDIVLTENIVLYDKYKDNNPNLIYLNPRIENKTSLYGGFQNCDLLNDNKHFIIGNYSNIFNAYT